MGLKKIKKTDKKSVADVIALTPMQEGMLFHYLLDPKKDYYYEQLCLKVKGRIDIDCFKEAWHTVVRSNEMLRTMFRWEKVKKPIQIILKKHTPDIREQDISDSPDDVKNIRLEKIRNNDRHDKFDLNDVPFRVTLCKISQQEYEIIISNHHILYDGWSTGIILKEFFAAYGTLSEGKTPPALIKPVFNEFIKWIKERDLKKQEKFWKTYLAGFEHGTQLPIKSVLGKDADRSGKKHRLILSAKEKENLETFSKERKVTVTALLFSTWGILLQKYNNCSDIVFGTTVSGRSAHIKGIENMVGLFINTLPLRLRTRNGDSLADICRNIQKDILAREPFESTSLVKIKEYCGVKTTGPLFDSIAAVENYPLESRLTKERGGLELLSYSMFERSQSDLAIAVEIRDEIIVDFNYKSPLLSTDTVVRLANHFNRILMYILEVPEIEPSHLDLLTEAEKEQVLVSFNSTSAPAPEVEVLHRQFEAQVRQSPDHIAVVGNAINHNINIDSSLAENATGSTHVNAVVTVSYKWLNQTANRLARRLREKGIIQGTIVALMLEPSVEMVTAQLAVLKAGGAYLPIAPEFPLERKRLMLADSCAKMLITQVSLLGEDRNGARLPDIFPSIELFVFGRHHIPTGFKSNIKSTVTPNDTAYIMYTSGSTGIPKGVVVEHRNVMNVLHWFGNHYNINSATHVLQFSNYIFDPSVEQIFGTLLYGGVLYLITRELVGRKDQMRRFILERQVNIVNFFPGMLDELLGDEALLGCIETVISGGEPLQHPVKDRIINSGYRLFNHYGPTETTIEAFAGQCSAESPTIGEPLPNVRCYILGNDGNVLPLGVPGEIYISGSGVSRGYLNNPMLTAEKFPQDPFWDESVIKMYKTGDIGKWLANGQIRFMGRIDRQVKIRGFRIELGEIENHILKFEGVDNVLVKLVTPESSDSDGFLCAYIITGTSTMDQEFIQKLKRYLASELPQYMIPSYFITLEKMPLMPNGKIDDSVLPVPGISGMNGYVPPQCAVQEKLVEIWSQLLGIENGHIGIDDDFFRLGGHSLNATTLIARMQKEFDKRITLAQLFELPTIRELARLMSDGESRVFETLEMVEEKEYYPLSSAQIRLFVLQGVNSDSTAYNMSAVMFCEGKPRLPVLENVFRDLIRRHESLRTSFILVEGQPCQKIHPYDELDFSLSFSEMESGVRNTALEDEGEDGFQWVMERKSIRKQIGSFIRPFNLTKPPLMRVGFIKLNEDNHILVVDMHHIISDGLSVEILVKEFASLYSDEILPPLQIRYRDYAHWQNSESINNEIRNQETYWLDVFSGELPILNLPLDFPRPLVQSFAGETIGFEIDSGTSVALKALAEGSGATLYMVLLALYNILLARLGGQSDIVVGTMTAGRNRPELESLMGMFVNTLALRNFPARNKSFIDFFGEVRDHTLGAFENQDYQLESLVKKVAADRDISRNPLFDVMFGLENTGLSQLDVPGLTLNPLDFDNKTAKFDLFFQAGETDEGLSFSVSYSTKLFRRDTVKRFISFYRHLASAIIEDPERSLGDLPMVDEEEMWALVQRFNNTSTLYNDEITIQKWFEEQAQQIPDRTALIGTPCPAVLSRRPLSGVDDGFPLLTSGCGSEFITYKELNKRSTVLAYRLRETGIGPGSIAAVMIGPSVDTVTVVLAILKAGGCYLPVDPQFPSDRIIYILDDSNAGILITHAPLIEKMIIARDVLLLDKLPEHEIEEYTEEDKALPDVSTMDPAYIIYTSGSTGKPRGTLVEQRSVINLLTAIQSDYPFTETDVSLLKTSLIFDVSVVELFSWFPGGGRLVVATRETTGDPALILDSIARFGITHINFIPSLFNLFVDFLAPTAVEKLKTLKYIFLAGEVLLPEPVRRFRSLETGIPLENLYGPTEATVYASSYSLSRWHDKGSILIGKPLANMRFYILSPHFRLQPVGIGGELAISGTGLSRGYLNNPEYTAVRFLKPGENSIHEEKVAGILSLSESGERIIYRTGDLARWLPDGSVEFLGRIDSQVKIRGYRIEPGEIENLLLTHDCIAETAVVIKTGRNGEPLLCGYFVPEKGKSVIVTELKDYIGRQLPDYMIPTFFMQLKQIPLTAGGKVDKNALPGVEGFGLQLETRYSAPRTDTEKKIAKVWMEVLNLRKVGIDNTFFSLGGTSLSMMRLAGRIKELYHIDVPIVTLFRYSTIRSFSDYIDSQEVCVHSRQVPMLSVLEQSFFDPGAARSDIAVIGMAGRFPGASNIEQFEYNLLNGVESITFFSDQELEEAGVPYKLINNPAYIKAKGILDDIEGFDAAFFDYIPAQAELMDPQVRIFHHICQEALEDACIDTTLTKSSIGLYAGASLSLPWVESKFDTGLSPSEQFEVFSLNGNSIALLVSYKLNLRGPAVTLSAACSTSLVAVDTACRAILSGSCDAALVGAVHIKLPHKNGYLFQEGMVMSPDGHCRAFDIKAMGTVGGEGAGVVVLKPLIQAKKDGNRIYAVIKGSAVNNDGIRKMGYTAPSVEGQAEVIRAALDNAKVDAETISYVEAHGTGTPLGDPLEIEGLKIAFNSERKNYCGIGSVKTNIGHLDTASGIAAFIKTVLALKNHILPPTLNFDTPNPKIDFENSPFYVVTEPQPWKTDRFPRRAGVSSFGIGGTNAHVILEEAPLSNDTDSTSYSSKYRLLMLSAKTEFSLKGACKNLVTFLEKNPKANLADVAYTLQKGRSHFYMRRAAVVETVEQAIEAFKENGDDVLDGIAQEDDRSLFFMFPGQGGQYINMGLDLYRTESFFRKEVDYCFEILQPLMDCDLKDILFPGLASGNKHSSVSDLEKIAGEKIVQTEIAQPLIFVFEYALARLLIHWGLRPWAMIGYGIGEYTAAHFAGVFSLEDVLKLVAARAKIMQEMPHGVMLAVSLPVVELRAMLPDDLSLAGIDSTTRCVVAGKEDAVAEFEKQLVSKNINHQRLKTSHALNSHMMEPVLEKFHEVVKRVRLNPPAVPYVSNLTGRWIIGAEVTDTGYWVRHLRNTIRFADGLADLLRKDNALFLEVGPGEMLSSFVRSHSGLKTNHLVVDLVRNPQKNIPDNKYLLTKMACLWLNGKSLDWSGFYSGQRGRFLQLPSYCFDNRRYRVDVWECGNRPKNYEGQSKDSKSDEKPGVNIFRSMTDWFYVPVWKRSPLPPRMDKTPGIVSGESIKPNCLVFSRNTSFENRLLESLCQWMDVTVVVERTGSTPARLKSDNAVYRIRPDELDDYQALFAHMEAAGKKVDLVVHLWGITSDQMDLGFFSLLNIAKSIPTEWEVRIDVITANMQDVTGDEVLSPGKATVLGPVDVIPREYNNIICRSIDVVLPSCNTPQENHLIRKLQNELRSLPVSGRQVAFRRNNRWVNDYDPFPLENNGESMLKEGGVYLITGGLGRIGITLARYLAEIHRARLVLIDRTMFPEREQWRELHPGTDEDEIDDDLIDGVNEFVHEFIDDIIVDIPDDAVDDITAEKVLKILEMESYGGEVRVHQADVAKVDQMQAVIRQVREEWGDIDGVFHCAGIAGNDARILVKDIHPRQCRDQFISKVHGLLVLKQIFLQGGKEPDFFLLISSMASVLGEPGFVAYSAGNRFMDHFIRLQNRENSVPWLSVNWDPWQLEELAAVANHPDDGLGVTPAEAMEVLERVLTWTDGGQVVTSIDPLEHRFQYLMKSSDPGASNNEKPNVEDRSRPRPLTPNTYLAPQTPLQRSVTDVWQTFFEIEKLGIDDDFHQLGGDSLKAISLVALIQKHLGVVIPVTEVFAAPTIRGMAEYIETLGEERKYSEIPPVEKREYYDLSPAQQRIFILQQMEIDGTTYNMPLGVQIEGIPDKEKTESVFRQLVKRHESLRTSFHINAGRPVQKISDDVDFVIEYFAGLNTTTVNLNEIVDRIIRNFIRPFDLSKPPLLRVALISVEETRHIIIADMHHIISDGVSAAVFVEEFMRLYAGEQLPDVSLTYKDYVRWCCGPDRKEAMAHRKKFWLERFRGDLPVLNLPYDFPRPAHKHFDGASIRFQISREETEALKALGRLEGCTLYMILLAIWNVLLAKLSGMEEIIVGTAAAGRRHADLQPIIGMFINTLAMWNKPSADKNFKHFLHEVGTNAQTAFENQDYPFEELVEQLNNQGVVQRDYSRSPIFDVMFILQNIRMPKMKTEELTLTHYTFDLGKSKFDLLLEAIETPDALNFKLDYSTALFKRETVDGFVRSFQKLISSVLTGADREISQLDID